MSLFVDTSALYPLLVGSEDGHDAVADVFRTSVREGRTLVTTNYVVLETCRTWPDSPPFAAVTPERPQAAKAPAGY